MEFTPLKHVFSDQRPLTGNAQSRQVPLDMHLDKKKYVREIYLCSGKQDEENYVGCSSAVSCGISLSAKTEDEDEDVLSWIQPNPKMSPQCLHSSLDEDTSSSRMFQNVLMDDQLLSVINNEGLWCSGEKDKTYFTYSCTETIVLK